MPITDIRTEEFSVFTDIAFKFCPGINVLIGANGTGKTHLLKVLYCVHRALEEDDTLAGLAGKLERVFRPDHIGRLVHRRVGVHSARVTVGVGRGRTSFELDTRGEFKATVEAVRPGAKAMFIPSREVLAIYEGFVSLYSEREVSFDETYYDLCVALGAPALRGPRGEKASKLIEPIERGLRARVELRGERFYVRSPDGNFEAHLVSEGLRKIATLARIIVNGSLAEKGILFWDEPEANLNPALARELVEFLRHLAHGGVQIFLATHDTLVAQRLSLAAEYGLAPAIPTRFIGLYREGTDVRADVGDVLADLSHNPLLDEFTRFHDDERRVFEASVAQDGHR